MREEISEDWESEDGDYLNGEMVESDNEMQDSKLADDGSD